MGGVLPPGLVGDCFLAGPSASGASLAAGFAAIPKHRLVLRWFTGNWGTGHEQLSADERHQPSPQPDEAVWMAGSDTKLQYPRRSQCARGERSLLQPL